MSESLATFASTSRTSPAWPPTSATGPPTSPRSCLKSLLSWVPPTPRRPGWVESTSTPKDSLSSGESPSPPTSRLTSCPLTTSRGASPTATSSRPGYWPKPTSCVTHMTHATPPSRIGATTPPPSAAFAKGPSRATPPPPTSVESPAFTSVTGATATKSDSSPDSPTQWRTPLRDCNTSLILPSSPTSNSTIRRTNRGGCCTCSPTWVRD